AADSAIALGATTPTAKSSVAKRRARCPPTCPPVLDAGGTLHAARRGVKPRVDAVNLLSDFGSVPRPVRQRETTRDVVGRARVRRQTFGGPAEVGLQRLAQSRVVGEPGVVERLRETHLSALVHVDMFTVA